MKQLVKSAKDAEKEGRIWKETKETSGYLWKNVHKQSHHSQIKKGVNEAFEIQKLAYQEYRAREQAKKVAQEASAFPNAVPEAAHEMSDVYRTLAQDAARRGISIEQLLAEIGVCSSQMLNQIEICSSLITIHFFILLHHHFHDAFFPPKKLRHLGNVNLGRSLFLQLDNQKTFRGRCIRRIFLDLVGQLDDALEIANGDLFSKVRLLFRGMLS